ncbi:MAG TPA: nucleotide pyrophosphohydrolase [Spirochaetes bacterium]|nr:nucleotide pyrophosphohydrolase [Spirochaetota bacterium]
MTLEDAQREVHKYVSQFKMGYWAPLSNLARLIEEVGELARELNHLYGNKSKKPTEGEGHIADEIGDILFTLICIANSEDIDLTTSLKGVIDKYNHRDRDRWDPVE